MTAAVVSSSVRAGWSNIVHKHNETKLSSHSLGTGYVSLRDPTTTAQLSECWRVTESIQFSASYDNLNITSVNIQINKRYDQLIINMIND